MKLISDHFNFETNPTKKKSKGNSNNKRFRQSKATFNSSNYKKTTYEKRQKKGLYKQDSFDFLKLVANWKKVVGDFLGENTTPLKIQYKKLIILTNHPMMANELKFLEEELLNKIFRKYPALKPYIKKINYFNTMDSAKDKARQPLLEDIKNGAKETKNLKIHPYSPQYRILKSKAEDLFSHIEDEELRNNFIRLFIQSHY